MAGRSAWTGAINFAGFPINVTAYAVTGKSAGSFKTLCGCHDQPVVAPKVCAVTHDVPTETKKGWEVAKGKLAVIPSEALDALKESATTVVEIERFAPRASIDFSFSKSLYRFIADPKVPGSEGPVNILWNGLLEGEYAAVIDGWISRGGSNPQTLVLHADDAGLRGNTLPYLTDLRDAPTGAFTQNEKAAAMFEQFVAINYTVADYDVSAYTDTYAEKREALIAQAIAGKEITVEETAAAPTGAAPDLMAAMEAALGGAGAKPKPKGGKKKAAVTA
jgi:non-homologous end joining protein Ku